MKVAARGDKTDRFTKVPDWVFQAGLSCHELAALVALLRYAPDIRPSQATLCRDAGMGRTKLIATLRSLESKGIVRTKHRADGNGRQQANRYAISAPVGVRHTNTAVHGANIGGSATRTPGCSPGEQGSVRDTNTNHTRNELEQDELEQERTIHPLPLKGGEGEGGSGSKQENGKWDRTRFEPLRSDLPACLLHDEETVELIFGFWEDNDGAKTRRAWDLLMRDLEAIVNDDDGGLYIVSSELSGAIISGQRKITYAAWLRKMGRI
jgi:hypothetical protein